MIKLLLVTIFIFWFILTEVNIFLRKKKDDGDHYHQTGD